eukprot:364208-Chlamydomonas_euryale.AAC.33
MAKAAVEANANANVRANANEALFCCSRRKHRAAAEHGRVGPRAALRRQKSCGGSSRASGGWCAQARAAHLARGLSTRADRSGGSSGSSGGSGKGCPMKGGARADQRGCCLNATSNGGAGSRNRDRIGVRRAEPRLLWAAPSRHTSATRRRVDRNRLAGGTSSPSGDWTGLGGVLARYNGLPEDTCLGGSGWMGSSGTC